MSQTDSGIEVFVANEQTEHSVDIDQWQHLAREVLNAEDVRSGAELSIMFVTEESIANLNRRFMDKAGPTDVLSFPIADPEEESGRSPDGGTRGPSFGSPEPRSLPYLLGDVVIAPAVAARQAEEHEGDRGHRGTLEDEIALLVVHGILHLRGLDHEEDDEAEEMEEKEGEYLARLYYRADPSPASAQEDLPSQS